MKMTPGGEAVNLFLVFLLVSLIAAGGCKAPADREWSIRTSGTSQFLTAVTYGNGKFIAEGQED